MANIDWSGIETQTKALAEQVLKDFVNQALTGAKEFKTNAQQQIQEWVDQCKAGEITQRNLDSLIRGEGSLAEMQALKDAGVLQIEIDTFTNGFLQIVINAAVAAIKL